MTMLLHSSVILSSPSDASIECSCSLASSFQMVAGVDRLHASAVSGMASHHLLPVGKKYL